MAELNQAEVNKQMYLFVKQWLDNITFEERKKVPFMAIGYCLARLSNQDELLQELTDLGYPHNFQRESPWVVDYLYKLTNILKRVNEVKNNDNT